MNVVDPKQWNCAGTRESAGDYLSGELRSESALAITKHIESCLECADELAARRRMRSLLQRAVRQEAAPSALRERIVERIHQDEAKAGFARAWHRPVFAIAALIVVASLIGWGVFHLWHRQSAHSAFQQKLNRTISEQSAAILNIGLGDHIKCAIEDHNAEKHLSDEEMAQHLGATYAELLPLVRGKIGDGYEVVNAHRCLANGRQFVHFILRKQNAILSLVITQKDRESFPSADRAMITLAADSPLYQARLQNFQVAGFDAHDYLVFVVSNLRAEDNLQIASNVAPAIHDFLARR